MKFKIVSPLLCAAFMICSSSAYATPPQSPKNIVIAMFDAFNRHDVDALVSLYAETAVLVSPDYCQPKHGKAAVREIYSGLFAAIPDVHDNLQTLIVSGDTVAVEFIATGQMGDFAIHQPIAAFIQVQNGLIIRDTGYFDTGTENQCSSESEK